MIGALRVNSGFLLSEESGWPRVAYLTLDHKVLGSDTAGGMAVWYFIVQSLPLSSFHCLDMT